MSRLQEIKEKPYFNYETRDNHVNSSDIQYLIKQAEKVEKYEHIIHAIANIDTMFTLPDGTEREWNDKEALTEIEKLVMPVWNEYCEEIRKGKVNL